MGISAKEVTKEQNIKYNKSHTVTFIQRERLVGQIVCFLIKSVKTKPVANSLILKIKTEGEEELLLKPDSFSAFYNKVFYFKTYFSICIA